MENILISVIVPVYNVEKYLRECIDSILIQTFVDFEIILVDDGSTDSSGEICDEYHEKDSRIKVFHKNNGGLSSARNKGLDEAKGDYVCFIDSDDTIAKDYLEKLLKAVKTNDADMALCDIDAAKLVESCSDVYDKSNYDDTEASGFIMDQSKTVKWLYDTRSREYVLMVIACNKLFSKELFSCYRFPENKLHEDEFMIGNILRSCRKISFVPEKLYIYRDNLGSITSDANRLDARHLDVIDAYSERIKQAINDGNSEFAIVTLKNALYKCARFYSDADKYLRTSNEAYNRNSDYANAVHIKNDSVKKYWQIYLQFKHLLGIKQKIKYQSFLVFKRTFIKIYNP